MALLSAFLLVPFASARFAWLDSKLPTFTDGDNVNDLLSGLFDDINLDITFAETSTLSPAYVDTSVDIPPTIVTEEPADFLIDEDHTDSSFAPFAPFAPFGHFGHFGGLFNRFSAMNPFSFNANPMMSDWTQYDDKPPSKPLYLMFHDDEPDTEYTPSVFELQQNNRVGGNTFRYTIKSDGNNQVFTSWSTPRSSKMYLCSSASCNRDDGMEMMNILDDFMDNIQKPRYLHLVPSTTEDVVELLGADGSDDIFIEMAPNDEDTEDMLFGGDDVDDFASWNSNWDWNWVDSVKQKAHGCHQKMQGLRDWYFGGEEMNMEPETTNNGETEIIFEIDEYEEVPYDEEDLEQADLYFNIACWTMIAMSLCGIVYSCYRYKSIKIAKSYDVNDYVVMEEADGFEETNETR